MIYYIIGKPCQLLFKPVHFQHPPRFLIVLRSSRFASWSASNSIVERIHSAHVIGGHEQHGNPRIVQKENLRFFARKFCCLCQSGAKGVCGIAAHPGLHTKTIVTLSNPRSPSVKSVQLVGFRICPRWWS